MITLKKVTLISNSDKEIAYRLMRDFNIALSYEEADGCDNEAEYCDCTFCKRVEEYQQSQTEEMALLFAAAAFYALATECHCDEYSCSKCNPF